jgi:hypothetical protein
MLLLCVARLLPRAALLDSCGETDRFAPSCLATVTWRLVGARRRWDLARRDAPCNRGGEANTEASDL